MSNDDDDGVMNEATSVGDDELHYRRHAGKKLFDMSEVEVSFSAVITPD